MEIKDIPGFEGYYAINEIGEVYGLPRITIDRHKLPLRKMKTFIGTTGYRMVSLYKERQQKMVRVHRILGKLFIPNPLNKKTINHKNGIRTDNRLENLEWSTQSENVKHSYDVLKRCLPDGARNPKSKLIIDLQTGIFYDSIKFAAIAKGIPRNILKRRLNYYGEYNSLTYA